MTKPGKFTYDEIRGQISAWVQALEITQTSGDEIERLWGKYGGEQILFTGCGSTYYLSLAAAALFQELTGRSARGAPAGELLLYPESTYGGHHPSILIAISRSGTTSETIAVVRQYQKSRRGAVLVITNDEDTPLGHLGDLTLAIPAGQEKSVAQTRSFASMYLAAVALATQVAGRDDLRSEMKRLPEIGEQLLDRCKPFAKEIGENLNLHNFYFLGSGPRYGLACEVNLKMKEMTLTYSEPFHFMEFRHGPMSMIKEDVAVIGLRSTAQHHYEQAVLDEMKKLGGQVFSLTETGGDLCFESGLPESIRNVLYLPPLQLMAFYRSLAKGFNPDKPQNLAAVVQLDLD